MAIIDKLLSVGEVVRDKVKETFGDPNLSTLSDDSDDDASDTPSTDALDVAGAYAALGVAEGCTLADVREAYRALARYHHPIATRDGDDSDAQKALDCCLEALELLEEHMLPLSPTSSPGTTPKAPPSTRKRATARK